MSSIKMLRILFVLVAVIGYVTFFWDVIPCNFVDSYDRIFC